MIVCLIFMINNKLILTLRQTKYNSFYNDIIIHNHLFIYTSKYVKLNISYRQ